MSEPTEGVHVVPDPEYDVAMYCNDEAACATGTVANGAMVTTVDTAATAIPQRRSRRPGAVASCWSMGRTNRRDNIRTSFHSI